MQLWVPPNKVSKFYKCLVPVLMRTLIFYGLHCSLQKILAQDNIDPKKQIQMNFHCLHVGKNLQNPQQHIPSTYPFVIAYIFGKNLQNLQQHIPSTYPFYPFLIAYICGKNLQNLQQDIPSTYPFCDCSHLCGKSFKICSNICPLHPLF